ncbi:hypothetical protein KS4_34370 [Poriferisphaera corsica]|uniref:Uncharacterized protein n=1 Tax=Poriferisphaera corsica TaxID=2528020 RepID=A0A517YYS2_9BACT|nr:hypothetical protein KS4_34370 [Poriferisphaera corsica]
MGYWTEEKALKSWANLFEVAELNMVCGDGACGCGVDRWMNDCDYSDDTTDVAFGAALYV